MALCKPTHDVISYFLGRLVLIKWRRSESLNWAQTTCHNSLQVTFSKTESRHRSFSHDDQQRGSIQLSPAAELPDGILFWKITSLSLTSLD